MISYRFIPLDGPRFLTLRLDGGALADGDVTFMRSFDDAIIRVVYEVTEDQAREIDNEAVRQELLRLGALSVTVQPSIVRVQRARVEGVDETLDERDALEAWCKAEGVEAEAHAVLDSRLLADLAEVGR